MKPSALRSVFVSLCIASQLLGPMVGTNQVACFADDGQVTFELAHVGACTKDNGWHDGKPATGSTIDVGRGDGCTDIALLQPALRDRGVDNNNQHTPQGMPCARFDFSAVPDVRLPARLAASVAVDLVSTALAARLTIVLLV